MTLIRYLAACVSLSWGAGLLPAPPAAKASEPITRPGAAAQSNPAAQSAISSPASQAAPAALAVTSGMECGSAHVVAIDQAAGVIHVQPGGDPKLGWPCWWCFKVTGIRPGDTIEVDLIASEMKYADGRQLSPDWALPRQAAFRPEGGAWSLTPPGERHGPRMIYRQKVDARTACFAWGPAFGLSDAAEVVRLAARTCPHATAFDLCRSRSGRAVPALRVSQPTDGQPGRYGVWVQARQHAWEVGSSWVCKGLIEWLAGDDERAAALRKKATFVLVPLLDVDNAVAGQGGKEQVPHDHNRDWSDEPVFPAVRAAQREILAMNQAGRLDLFIDLHNPGPYLGEPLFNTPLRANYSERGWNNFLRFLAAATTEIDRPVACRGRYFETGPAYSKSWQQMGEHWVNRHAAGHVVSTALEWPNNTAAATPEGYQAAGRQLGLAIERYLRTDPR